ncbi:hypothetical protein F2P81_018547 [Scophthalmus maximus]|uniref:Uncharacterized protein n=1 Tax=Scophthalmus maximus TaxID=52904 RepID=A0A6A4SGF4_SCOMX|nr:hypothetical protein F2P81_018547 [Scophthalmus maximus]
MDLNDTLPHLRLKITNVDSSDLVADAPVALINYPLNTIFSQCNVVLRDRLISQSSTIHPYRSMIETLLSFSEQSLKTQFSAGLIYKDTAGAVDSVVIPHSPNRGFERRGRFTANSREVHLLGPLHADIFFSKRFLLNSVDLRIKLSRANDAFALMCPANTNYKL